MTVNLYTTTSGATVICGPPHRCPYCGQYSHLWVNRGGVTQCWLCDDRRFDAPRHPDAPTQ